MKWEGLVGGNIDSKFGVLQGGMLSSKFFTEFLTDLHRYLSAECSVLMSNLIISYILFADDLIICSTNSQNTFKLNSSHLIEKAQRAMFGLISHIKDSVGFLPLDLSVKMFDKQIRPILDYACEVCYMGKQDHDIEKILLGYLKSLLNIKPSSSCRVW